MGDFVRQQHTVTGFSSSDSWVILSPIEQSIKRKIEAVGVPLKDWDIQIYRGVLTGCNEAFIISSAKREEILSNCRNSEERKHTEEIIRPILRGRDIRRYGYDWAGLWLINTHNGIKGKVERIHIEDYPAVKAHLDKYWDKISIRADQGDTPYNLRNCAYLEDFMKTAVVWARLTRISKKDIDDFPRFCHVEAGMFVADSLCFFTGVNTELLCRMLNSTYAAYYFFRNVPILDNGGLQMRQQFVEQIPFPRSLKDVSVYREDTLYKAFNFTKKEIDFIQEFVCVHKKEIVNVTDDGALLEMKRGCI